MKVKGPVACLLATLISVLATVTVAADTDTDSSATAAHGLRVSKAKEENRALQDLPQLSELRQELKTLNGEAKAAALAVKKKRRQVDRAKFLLDMETVWEECPRFGPTAEHSCDPDTLTSKCHYGKKCEDVDGKCKRKRHCECVAGKFSCTKQEGTCIPCGPLTKEKCEAMLNCDLDDIPVDPSVRVATRTECEILNDCSAPGNRGVPVDVDGEDFRDLTYGFAFGAGWPPTHEYSKKYGIKFGCWDVSQVTDMSGALGRAGLDIPLCWDVSSVTNMHATFVSGQFNQDISFWDVSSVTDFSLMFYNQKRFNQDISAWNVSSAVTMKQMFSKYYRYGLNTHNQNLCDWAPKISADTDTFNMFTNSYCPTISGGLQ
jgi:hypothetical protein